MILCSIAETRSDLMKKTELAWAAGIVDGEGCVTISHVPAKRQKGCLNDRHALYLKVTMGDKPTVDRLHKLFGIGSVQINIQKKYNTAWSWLCCSRDAGIALRKLLPYLVTKRAETLLAIEFDALPLYPGGSHQVPQHILIKRHKLYEKVRNMKPSARFRKHLHKNHKLGEYKVSSRCKAQPA